MRLTIRLCRGCSHRQLLIPSCLSKEAFQLLGYCARHSSSLLYYTHQHQAELNIEQSKSPVVGTGGGGTEVDHRLLSLTQVTLFSCTLLHEHLRCSVCRSGLAPLFTVFSSI